MPSFDEMLKDMPMHYSFYLRGVANSLLPAFMNPMDREVTEKNISGEALEFLRLTAQTLRPNLQEGEIAQINSQETWPMSEQFGDINKALGSFGLTKVDGQYVIFDTYDFSPKSLSETLTGSMGTPSEISPASASDSIYGAARYMGGVLMPENDDGSSRDDAMRIRIAIPNEPSVIDVDYDDDIPEGAEDFVFRGPMTNKRKSMFDAFTSMLGEAAAQLNPISEANARLLETNTPDMLGNIAGEFGSEGSLYGGSAYQQSITRAGINKERQLQKIIELPK